MAVTTERERDRQTERHRERQREIRLTVGCDMGIGPSLGL